MYSDNNLFRFATKELSQDAILAWTINGINGKDKSLKALGKTLLKAMIGWEGDTDFSDVVVLRQVKNMDILISFMHDGLQHLVIVEDKVGSSIHDNQLERYINEVLDMRKAGELSPGTDPYDPFEKELPSLKIDKYCIVHLALVKTRLITDKEHFAIKRIRESYDEDVLQTAKIVSADDILRIYKPYQGNMIVDIFVDHIKRIQEPLLDIRHKVENGDLSSIEIKDLISSEAGQWYLMKKLLPTKDDDWQMMPYPWIDGDKRQTEINILWNDRNSSGGAPYTELWFWCMPCMPSKSGPFYKGLNWRLDTYHLCLAYYVDYANLPFYGELPEAEREELKQCNDIITMIMRDISCPKNMIRKSNPKPIHKKNTLLTIYLTKDSLPFNQLKDLVQGIHRKFIELYKKDHPTLIGLVDDNL